MLVDDSTVRPSQTTVYGVFSTARVPGRATVVPVVSSYVYIMMTNANVMKLRRCLPFLMTVDPRTNLTVVCGNCVWLMMKL